MFIWDGLPIIALFGSLLYLVILSLGFVYMRNKVRENEILFKFSTLIGNFIYKGYVLPEIIHIYL